MADETATVPDERSMQDITSDIEGRLFPAPDTSEPEGSAEDVVLEDDESLPEEDDTESVDDEGSEDETVNEDDSEDEMTLADFLGVDEDRIIQDEEGRWMLNAKVDGEEKAVPLSELTKSYQFQSHVNNKSIALETERKEFQEQRSQVATELKERVDGIMQMSGVLEQELAFEFNNINWDKLKQDDPGRWASLRQDYGEKAQRIQEIQALASEESKRQAQEQTEYQQAQFQEHLRMEKEKMLAQNPSWVDQEVLQKDMTTLKGFVQEAYGFTEEDTNLVTDHRLIGLIQDAHKYRSGESARKNAESKKEKVVPKFQKSKATATKTSSIANARRVKAKRAAVKKTGSVDDVANLLIDRM